MLEMPDGRAVSSIGLHDVQLLALRLGLERRATSAGCAPTAARRTSTAITGRPDRRASTVVVQVVRQDVLPGELDPGGFPRRYQYLVDEGVGVSTSTVGATTCAGSAGTPTT